ncbi:hypothetical protein AUJ84_03880 [Candidatus Pacearchaeota archaeon CG1_02_32_132]|nr:MAG: hypothetical protein AUJ84_03880 [Candidatus Pacearchaeota archaeon CG1_02_32_132]
MNKRGLGTLGIIAIVVVVLVIGFVSYKSLSSSISSQAGSSLSSNPSGNEGVGDSMMDESSEGSMMEDENVIKVISTGFVPNTLTINSGDTITWINENTAGSWPASDVHPTHTSYPGSAKSKCGTSEQSMIFDACGGLKEGESYSFTFDEVGSWNFHDHLKPNWVGTVIVK